MCYYPAQTSESTQAIDAGLGRSVRIAVGNALDNWLMDEENMLKWEGKMTASKRRVLINHLVAEATETVVKKDEMRVNCFVRTGSLLHWTKSESDDLIKLQGVKSKIIAPDACVEDEQTGQFVEPTESVTPQEELMGNVSTDIIDDTVAGIADNINQLTICEDENEADPELRCEEVMEDVSVVESEDEFEFQG